MEISVLNLYAKGESIIDGEGFSYFVGDEKKARILVEALHGEIDGDDSYDEDVVIEFFDRTMDEIEAEAR